MKHEFSIAIWLLATACLLVAAAGMTSFDRAVDNGNADRSNSQASQQRTYRQFKAPAAGDDLDPKQLLLKAATNLYHADPLHAAARMSLNLFGEEMVIHGRYYQLNQARGSRLEFVYGDEGQPSTIQQIADGQFYYRYKSADGGQPTVDVADLSALAKTDEQDLFADLLTWRASGGLASMLAHLAHHFQFEEVKHSSIDQTPVLILSGKWKEDRIRRLLYGQTNNDFIKHEIQWDKLPENLPQAVEIVLGNDTYFPLFPYRISWLRHPADGGRDQLVKIVKLELHELTINAELPEEIFRVTSDSTPNDLTGNLVHRIRGLKDAIRSAEFKQLSNRKR